MQDVKAVENALLSTTGGWQHLANREDSAEKLEWVAKHRDPQRPILVIQCECQR